MAVFLYMAYHRYFYSYFYPYTSSKKRDHLTPASNKTRYHVLL